MGRGRNGIHAEEDLINQAGGIEKIDALFTERAPCDNKCDGLLRDTDVDVSYAFPWNHPEESIRLVLGCLGSHDPRTRRVGLWGLAVIDFGGAKYFGLVADAASDPDPRVRADVMSTLGSVFGVGDPSRARAILIAGACDPAPEVRSSAVAALGSSRDESVTDLLVACADDTDRSVRFSAAWSLAHRPGSPVRAALERLAADEEGDVRDAARRVRSVPVTPV
ncbi:HEAT repeat domain-containing protein [Streptomyces sp. NPDC087317]|uniref:HEAT repeat domain-containing protein n=1 Tax=Streptomyces sp. NPDC087317 TaxID=3365784 RepID=UPI003810D7AD